MSQPAYQNSLPFADCPITQAVAALSAAAGEERGAVFTRREVVDFILDLIGYTSDRPLQQFRLLEPACGHGDFLLPAVERLLDCSAAKQPIAQLATAIRAVEIHRASANATRHALHSLLESRGYSPAEAATLVRAWIIDGDFLLTEMPGHFTHVVGNPPYLRQEQIPAALLTEYRLRYATIYDRADLYVPFFERGLDLLGEGGTLGFICSDRWMKNKYGGPLRTKIARDFHLACYVDMVDTPAFNSPVIAYPAITVITRERGVITRIAHRPTIDAERLAELARSLHGEAASNARIEAEEIAKGAEPWILHAPAQTALVRRLEARWPTLDEAGCKVGIGVATGADRVYIAPYDQLDVEPDCKLPLVTTRDINDGHIVWRGLGVINPFAADGTPVDLNEHPRLARYLAEHEAIIRRRNVAQRNPRAWFRTIDRILPDLVAKPKLLIPDIKGAAHVVLDEGAYYPHHNLYYIVSNEWNLLALQAVLRSGIARLFVATYSVQMRGGHLRFQAQYLRRIRLPRWSDLPEAKRDDLITASMARDAAACERLVFDLYELNEEERELMRGEQE